MEYIKISKYDINLYINYIYHVYNYNKVCHISVLREDML